MKKKLYLLIGAVAMCFASCSNFLEEYSQDTAYVRGYEDLDELLLGACYMPVVSPSHFGIALGDLGLTTDADDDYYYPYIHLLADEVGENITDGGDVSIRNGDARDRFFVRAYHRAELIGVRLRGPVPRRLVVEVGEARRGDVERFFDRRYLFVGGSGAFQRFFKRRLLRRRGLRLHLRHVPLVDTLVEHIAVLLRSLIIWRLVLMSAAFPCIMIRHAPFRCMPYLDCFRKTPQNGKLLFRLVHAAL